MLVCVCALNVGNSVMNMRTISPIVYRTMSEHFWPAHICRKWTTLHYGDSYLLIYVCECVLVCVCVCAGKYIDV